MFLSRLIGVNKCKKKILNYLKITSLALLQFNKLSNLYLGINLITIAQKVYNIIITPNDQIFNLF